MMKKRDTLGFGLIELLVSISIFSVILGYSTIFLHELFDKKRLESTAQKIYTDLRLAQSESIKYNAPVYVSFSQGLTNWCYGMNLYEPCDCNTSQSCKLIDRDTAVDQSMFRNISLLKAKFAGNKNYTAFDPRKGFAIGGGVKNGTVWLASKQKDLIAVVVSRVGRVRLCSPSFSEYSTQCPKAPTI